jgi:hypothetical protein
VFGSDVSLPPESVLLHIGPHKTGTTAVQSALHLARGQLHDEHAIHYAGRRRQPMRAAIAVTRSAARGDVTEPAWDKWGRLVKHVDGANGQRVVVSSEYFCEAHDEDVVRRIVDELGGERVHIVVTLRSLSGLLPSQWQQHLQSGLRMPYDEWLGPILDGPLTTGPLPLFWRRHDHGALVERWAAVVGPRRLAVVVPDPADRASLLNGFETILRLPQGLLVPEPGRSNRSLTVGEAELLRRINVQWHDHGWGREAYHEVMRAGVIRRLVTSTVSGVDDQRISTPQWALTAAAKFAEQAAQRIETSGVAVIGDLAWLSDPPANPSDVRTDEESLPIGRPSVETAVEAVLGAILSNPSVTGVRRDPAQLSPPEPATKPVRPLAATLRQASFAEIRDEMRARARRRFRRRVGR